MSAPVKGDVLRYQQDNKQTARVCRVTPYTVMLAVGSDTSPHFYTIPLLRVWGIFEKPEEAASA